jgi:tetratricopeptide (TPR) repeat protein
MEDKMPSSVISMPSKELQYQISQIYNGTGNKEKVKYHLKELTQRDDIEMEDYLLYGRSFIQNLDDYAEAKLIFKTIYDNFLIIEKAIKKQGFTSTKITAQEWQSWQKTLPELVFLLYLCHRELEEYDEATMLIENWIVRSPEDIDAGQLLDEIEKLKGL